MQWIAQVKDKSSPRVVIVGKEHTAGRHGVFGVVHSHSLLIGSQRRYQTPIPSRRGVGIDHRKKIIALMVRIAGPHKKIILRRSSFVILREQNCWKPAKANKQRQGKYKSCHVYPSGQEI